MSRVHMRFVKESENEFSIVYRVDSADFSKTRGDEPIARVTINRTSRTYSFEPLGELSNSKIVPPFVYDLPEQERDRVLRTEYEGHGYAYGGWTSRIASVVRRILNSGEFPDETYGVTYLASVGCAQRTRTIHQT